MYGVWPKKYNVDGNAGHEHGSAPTLALGTGKRTITINWYYSVCTHYLCAHHKLPA